MLLPYTILGMEAIVEDTNLATACSGSNILSSKLNDTQQPLLIAKDFAASKSTDDGLQVSLSDDDLQAFPDNRQEVVLNDYFPSVQIIVSSLHCSLSFVWPDSF